MQPVFQDSYYLKQKSPAINRAFLTTLAFSGYNK